jgi:hemoglobin-like flavoprotein
MTRQQIRLIRSAWKRFRLASPDAEATLYAKLVQLAPDARHCFEGQSPTRGEQLLAWLDTAVVVLDRPAELVRLAQRLGARHAARGVCRRHYVALGTALMFAIGDATGKWLTPEMERAWAGFYVAMARTMRAAGRHESRPF